jgi:hypothetical protein
VAAAGRVLPQLASAYRTGDGVPYAAYGPDGVSARRRRSTARRS